MSNLEYEVRYYFSFQKLNEIISKLKKFENLQMRERSYEKTAQFDHPSDECSFYSKDIDGRFRVRVTQNSLISKCKLSWKRRIKSTFSTNVNKEEEVELTIRYDEYENLMFIITNVLKMKPIESYERYRTVFENEEIEIAVDEYPFGIALEIENKSTDGNPETIVEKWVKVLNLDLKNAYRLSWDDKYTELCKQQGVEHLNYVTFGAPMPKILD